MKAKAIEQAVKKAGGQTALANAIGVSQGLVWQWLQQGKPIPTRHFGPIERVTGVTAAALLADEMVKVERTPARPKRSPRHSTA
jgi:DNA-binding transcriptional regulator YdaS (Cro superfamily)